MNFKQPFEENQQHKEKLIKSVNKETNAPSSQGAFENKYN